MRLETLLDGTKAAMFITLVFAIAQTSVDELERNNYPIENIMSDELYFNTTHETSDDLKAYKIKASSQNAKVYDIFKRNPSALISPSGIHRIGFRSNTPITSIRRSITVLTGHGLLVKTDNKVKGLFGRDEYMWKFAGGER